MPAQLRRTVRRAIPAAFAAMLLVAALPQAALAAETSHPNGTAPFGLVVAGGIAAILALTAALSVSGQVKAERMRMHSPARHVARRRLAETARRHRSAARRAAMTRTRAAVRHVAAH